MQAGRAKYWSQKNPVLPSGGKNDRIEMPRDGNVPNKVRRRVFIMVEKFSSSVTYFCDASTALLR